MLYLPNQFAEMRNWPAALYSAAPVLMPCCDELAQRSGPLLLGRKEMK